MNFSIQSLSNSISSLSNNALPAAKTIGGYLPSIDKKIVAIALGVFCLVLLVVRGRYRRSPKGINKRKDNHQQQLKIRAEADKFFEGNKDFDAIMKKINEATFNQFTNAMIIKDYSTELKADKKNEEAAKEETVINAITGFCRLKNFLFSIIVV